jgi:type IV fimbrial biogenesis protein FimT
LLGCQEKSVLMKALPRVKSAGFTLVELMLTVAVLGILVGLGMPSFTKAIRNAEIRSAAESVANGLQRARAEAVSRNAKVQFVLGTGTSWTVDYVTKPVPTDPALDSRASSDSLHATLTAKAADLATAATTITFNQLGQVIANADASLALSQVTFVATGGNQTLLVKVGAGGNAKVCDPSLPASNIRSCSHA